MNPHSSHTQDLNFLKDTVSLLVPMGKIGIMETWWVLNMYLLNQILFYFSPLSCLKTTIKTQTKIAMETVPYTAGMLE